MPLLGRCTLEYARRTARLEEDNVDDWSAQDASSDAAADANVSNEHKAIAAASPMAHDVFDEDEEMNRRAEVVDLKNGGVFARTCATRCHQPVAAARPPARVRGVVTPTRAAHARSACALHSLTVCALAVQMWRPAEPARAVRARGYERLVVTDVGRFDDVPLDRQARVVS
jgi:hypothetical protein